MKSGKMMLIAAGIALLAGYGFCDGDSVALKYPGGYRLTVKDGKPSFEGDAEGVRHAKTAWRRMRLGKRRRQVGDCVVEEWPVSSRRGVSLCCEKDGLCVSNLMIVVDALAQHRMNVLALSWKEIDSVQLQPERIAKNQEAFLRFVHYAYKRGISVALSASADSAVGAWTSALRAKLPEKARLASVLRDEEVFPSVTVGTVAEVAAHIESEVWRICRIPEGRQ